MPNTYVLISSTVLGSSQATVTFSSIPSTYTDLLLNISGRSDLASINNDYAITFNGDTGSNYSMTYILGNGASVTTGRSTASNIRVNNSGEGTNATANTFDNTWIYIPNYLATIRRPISSHSANENNNSTAYMGVQSSLYRGTSGISSISIGLQANNHVAGSSFYLYGIKNS